MIGFDINYYEFECEKKNKTSFKTTQLLRGFTTNRYMT